MPQRLKRCGVLHLGHSSRVMPCGKLLLRRHLVHLMVCGSIDAQQYPNPSPSVLMGSGLRRL